MPFRPNAGVRDANVKVAWRQEASFLHKRQKALLRGVGRHSGGCLRSVSGMDGWYGTVCMAWAEQGTLCQLEARRRFSSQIQLRVAILLTNTTRTRSACESTHLISAIHRVALDDLVSLPTQALVTERIRITEPASLPPFHALVPVCKVTPSPRPPSATLHSSSSPFQTAILSSSRLCHLQLIVFASIQELF